jgi:hypothetical protein
VDSRVEYLSWIQGFPAALGGKYYHSSLEDGEIDPFLVHFVLLPQNIYNQVIYKEQKFIFLSFGGWEGQDQDANRFNCLMRATFCFTT